MDTFAQASTARQALTAGSILSLTLLIICSIRCLLFFTSIHSRATGRQPPTLPYIIPVVGSALTYITNPFKFVTTAGSVVPLSQPNHKLTPCSTDPNHPVRIKLLARDVVLVRGHANIQRLWRQTRLTTSTALFSFMLHTLFGMRWQAARRAFPLGAGLGPLVGRFAGKLAARLRASLDAMCLPAFLRPSPEFPGLFWRYGEDVAGFSKGWPRFWNAEGVCGPG